MNKPDLINTVSLLDPKQEFVFPEPLLAGKVASDLIRIPIADKKYLDPWKLIPDGGLTMVGGTPGDGKSFLIRKLAMGFAYDGHKVLHFAAEESFDDASRCFRKMWYGDHYLDPYYDGGRTRAEAIDDHDVSPLDNYKLIVGSLLLDTDDGRKEFAYHVRDWFQETTDDVRKWVTQKRIVIVDPFTDFFTGDENSARDVKMGLAPLKALREMGITVILVHHTGKDDSKTYRGSSAIQGSVDVGSVTSTTAAAGKDVMFLEITKNRFDREPDYRFLIRRVDLLHDVVVSDELVELTHEEIDLYNNNELTVKGLRLDVEKVELRGSGKSDKTPKPPKEERWRSALVKWFAVNGSSGASLTFLLTNVIPAKSSKESWALGGDVVQGMVNTGLLLETAVNGTVIYKPTDSLFELDQESSKGTN